MSAINFRDSFSRLAIRPFNSFFTSKLALVVTSRLLPTAFDGSLSHPSKQAAGLSPTDRSCKLQSDLYAVAIFYRRERGSFSTFVNGKTEKWPAPFLFADTRAQHLLSQTIGSLVDSGLMRGRDVLVYIEG